MKRLGMDAVQLALFAGALALAFLPKLLGWGKWTAEKEHENVNF